MIIGSTLSLSIQAGNDLPNSMSYEGVELILNGQGTRSIVFVKIYESGDALRANLYLTGRKDLILTHYRASDAVTLAVYYNIPIMVRKNMLQDPIEKSAEYYKAN